MLDRTTDAAPATRKEVGGSDEELALKLWVVLTRAVHAVSELARRDIAATGLTPGEFAVLEVLYHKGPLLLGDVREKILVSSGGITYLVDRLAEKGLVERRVCETDRRASYAVLTGEGERRIAEVFPGHARMLATAFEKLEPEEKVEAIRLLKKVGLHAETLDT